MISCYASRYSLFFLCKTAWELKCRYEYRCVISFLEFTASNARILREEDVKTDRLGHHVTELGLIAAPFRFSPSFFLEETCIWTDEGFAPCNCKVWCGLRQNVLAIGFMYQLRMNGVLYSRGTDMRHGHVCTLWYAGGVLWWVQRTTCLRACAVCSCIVLKIEFAGSAYSRTAGFAEGVIICGILWLRSSFSIWDETFQLVLFTC